MTPPPPDEAQSPGTTLPPLYDRWRSAFLEGSIPEETKATCSACAMLQPEGSPASTNSLAFLPNTKCCTYTPQIPNFLVGSILNDDSQEMARGRETTRTRLASRQVVTPLFLGRSIEYERRYMGSRERYFGRMAALKCPHYVEDGGLCSIWRHREAVCSTYFCKHNRGAIGLSFWRRLREFLTEVEKEISRWCALSLGVEPKVVLSLSNQAALPGILSQLEHEANEPHLGQHEYHRLWGNWLHKEEEFFSECGRLVANLDWQSVVSLAGQELAARAGELAQAFDKLRSSDIPDRLVAMPLQFNRDPSSGSYIVETYSPTDPVRISERLFYAITQFDGSDNEQILDRLLQNSGVKLSPQLIRKLVDFGILGEA